MLKRLFLGILFCVPVILSAKEGFRMDMFPMVFMKNQPFAIVEDLPATVHVRAWALTEKDKREFGKQTPVLVIDLPDFLRLAGAQLKMAEQTPWRNLKITRKNQVQYNAVQYQRYEIPFYFGNSSWNNRLGVKVPHYANNFQIYLEAKKGSASRQGKLHASVRFGKKTTPLYTYPVEVLEAVKPTVKVAKYFEVILPSLPGQEAKLEKLMHTYADFWLGLSRKTSIYRTVASGKLDASLCEKIPQDHSINSGKTLPCLVSPYYNENGFHAWRRLVISKQVPTLILSNGKPFRNPTIDAPVWYYLEDPEKLYENYLVKGFRSFREHYPELRRYYWDYEPGLSGYDEKGRTLFAKEMKLENVPSIQELVKGKYARKWFDYQVRLHQKHLEKVVRIFRRELPGREFWLCTDPLHAQGQNPAAWCAVDNLLADKVVDGHKPMPYYTGLRFFEDMRYNREKLLKRIIPLGDPAEREKRFFENYTPETLAQNILSAAALGCQGYGFWPDLAVTGQYLHKIRDALSLVAQAEEFYVKGSRADQEMTVEYCNTVTATLPYAAGKRTGTITVPDHSQNFRSLTHKLNGEYVVTLLNYDRKNPVFVKLKFKKKDPYFVFSEFDGVRYTGADPVIKVAPDGMKVVKYGRTPATQLPADSRKIKQELEENIKHTIGNAQFSPVCKGANSANWVIHSKGKRPLLLLKNGKKQYIYVDAYGVQQGIVNWTKGNYARLLGQIMMYDQSRISAPYPFTLREYYANEEEAACQFDYVFRTQDAAGEAFALQDLKITQKFALRKDGRILLEYTLSNESDHTIKPAFRIHNIPYWRTKSFAINGLKVKKKPVNQQYLLLRKGVKTPYSSSNLEQVAWDGSPLQITSEANHSLSMEAPDFAGIYIFAGKDFETITLEPVTSDFILKKGEKKTFRIFFSVPE